MPKTSSKLRAGAGWLAKALTSTHRSQSRRSHPTAAKMKLSQPHN